LSLAEFGKRSLNIYAINYGGPSRIAWPIASRT
jgi:hypothetical protein